MRFNDIANGRDFGLDVLKVVGLFCIILAHVKPVDIVFQVRNFDVPLMVFLSGFSFYISGGVKGSYREYFFKRVKRLVIPVWIFFCLFFFVLNIC
jgi:fucose 4-O-acetylase-like acetyltransferase